MGGGHRGAVEVGRKAVVVLHPQQQLAVSGRVVHVEGGLLKDVWIYARTRGPSGREVGPRYAYFDDGVLVRIRDETAETEPFDPVALVLMPFAELVNLVFDVVTLPLAPFSD